MTTPLDLVAIRRHILATMGVGLWVGRDVATRPSHWPSRFGMPPVQQPIKEHPAPSVVKKPTPSVPPTTQKTTQPVATSPTIAIMPILQHVRVDVERYRLSAVLVGQVLIMADQEVLDERGGAYQEGWIRLVDYLRSAHRVIPVEIEKDEGELQGGAWGNQRRDLFCLALQMYYSPFLEECAVMLLTPIEGIWLGDLLKKQRPAPALDQLYENPALIDNFL